MESRPIGCLYRLIVAGGVGMALIVAALGVVMLFDGSADAAALNCRSGDVLDGVHDPSRLVVIAPCVAARGTVADVRIARDGDWHIHVVPDPADLELLGRGNVLKAAGLLVVEVIPMDQPGLKLPRPGSRVDVTGAYVLDTNHGWREIHPAWHLVEIAPSPVPTGTGTAARQTAAVARRAIIRLRAVVHETAASLAGRGTGGEVEDD